MDPKNAQDARDTDLFARAEWYDRSINWSARLKREIQVLAEVFGPPGAGGILDAGCGTGHQACALAKRGYRVVGADAGEEMLERARHHARDASVDVKFVLAPYAAMHEEVGGGFDGVYCIGNALAAAGTRDAVAEAVEQFGQCLRPGGRLFVQVLNFPPMRKEVPCVRGPRVTEVDGRQYISIRHYGFTEDAVHVTKITLYEESGWQQRVHGGMLYPVTLGELSMLCESAGLRVDSVWGDYERDDFRADDSVDILVVATKR